MKNKNILFKIICIGILFFSACNHTEFFWKGEEYAKIVGPEIWTVNTDSMTFSFAIYPETDSVRQFLVEAEVVIMGEVSEKDRQVKLAVNANKTTAKSSDYSLSNTDIIIKAGEHSAAFPIMIYWSEELRTINKVLNIQVVETEDFKIGVVEKSTLTIIWNDKLTKPVNWDDLVEFFGEYSDAKYRFIINTLGIGQFTYPQVNGMSWGEMYNFRLVLVEELAKYNAENPNNPLTDENNNLVSFD